MAIWKEQTPATKEPAPMAPPIEPRKEDSFASTPPWASSRVATARPINSFMVGTFQAHRTHNPDRFPHSTMHPDIHFVL